MRQGGSFAEVLERVLEAPVIGCGGPVPAGIGTMPFMGRLSGGCESSWAAKARSQIAYGAPAGRTGADCVSPHTEDGQAGRSRTPAGDAARGCSTRPVVPRRGVRVLSVRQQRALDVLIRLGATLDAGYSDAELRTAFRMLAGRYHPDRHPHRSAAEQRNLAAVFMQVREAYSTLRRPAVS